MKIRQLVKQYVVKSPNVVPHDVALALRPQLDAAQVEEAVQGYIMTLAAEYRQIEMARLTQEYSAITASTASSSSKSGRSTSKASAASGPQASNFLAKRRNLLTRLIWVPGHANVAFGQMTVLHHTAVADHLVGTIKGVNDRIVAHHRAIEEITGAGVTCLDDLPDASSIEAELTSLV